MGEACRNLVALLFYKAKGQVAGQMAQDDNSPERLQKFRALAAEAWQSSRKAKSPEMQREYENLALAWGELIAELERLDANAATRAH